MTGASERTGGAARALICATAADITARTVGGVRPATRKSTQLWRCRWFHHTDLKAGCETAGGGHATFASSPCWTSLSNSGCGASSKTSN